MQNRARAWSCGTLIIDDGSTDGQGWNPDAGDLLNHIYCLYDLLMSGKNQKTSKEHGKLVRDSFTIPAGEYEAIDALKKLYLEHGIHMKKSEILRAGLIALSSMELEELKAMAERVERIKPGRPKKSG